MTDRRDESTSDSGRGRPAHRSVAVRLVVAFAVAAQAGRLPAADDIVADAATARAGHKGQQRAHVSLDQQIDSLFAAKPGADRTEQPRRRLFEAIQLEVDALAAVCSLTDEQESKCLAAARLDAAHATEGIERLRQRYAGRTLDLQDPAGQAEWQRFHKEAQDQQMRMQQAAGRAELLGRVIEGTLDAGQREAWRREQDQRMRFQWQSMVDAGMAQLDVALGLTSAQHGSIRGLLLEQPLRLNLPRVWATGNHFAPFLCKHALSRIDHKKLKPLVNDRQWKTLGQFIEQGKGITAQLKQQQMIVE